MDLSPRPTKRLSPDDHASQRVDGEVQGESANKRQRTSPPELESSRDPYNVSQMKGAIEECGFTDFARDGMRRSIAVALQHVGFDSASPEALESVTLLTETYLSRIISQLKSTAEAARREHPTPIDFDQVLKEYNIPLSSLKPHIKHPVAKAKLEPEYYDPLPILEHEDYFRNPPMDFLGPELDGDAERNQKPWIPDTLPSFPSKHTYKFTAVETAIPDLDKKRATAAADARRGEKALREINRAAKKSQQKELKEMAQRGAQSRQRHDNWESMMKAFIPRSGATDESQEIADQITTVDHSATFTRREVPKISKRVLPDVLSSNA